MRWACSSVVGSWFGKSPGRVEVWKRIFWYLRIKLMSTFIPFDFFGSPYQLIQNWEAFPKEFWAIRKKGDKDKQSSSEPVDQEYNAENPLFAVPVCPAVFVLECHWLLHRAIAVDQARQELAGQAWLFFTEWKYLVHQQKVNKVTQGQSHHTEIEWLGRYWN